LLNETLKRIEICNIIVSFIGVVVIIFVSNKPTAAESLSEVTNILYASAICLNITSAFVIALIFTVIRKLKGVHETIINGFYGTILACVSVIVWLMYRKVLGNDVEYNFDLTQWLLIIFIGISTCIGNQMVIVAVTHDKAGRVASLRFLHIVLGYIEDILIFGYELRVLECLCAMTIVLSSVATFILKYLKMTD
jgi:drug/metabolite transporter (DMT)-like permease